MLGKTSAQPQPNGDIGSQQSMPSIGSNCYAPPTPNGVSQAEHLRMPTEATVYSQEAQVFIALAQAVNSQAHALSVQAQALMAYASSQGLKAQPQFSSQSNPAAASVSECGDENIPIYINRKAWEGGPRARNPTYTPLIVTRNPDNSPQILEAKMDTGADVNFIALKVLQRLGREDEVRKIQDLPAREIGGNNHVFNRTISLDFHAGRHKNLFQNVEFLVTGVNGEDTDHDGEPDVLLGWRVMHEHNMIMTDLEYDISPDSSYDKPLNKRAEEVACEPVIGLYHTMMGSNYPIKPRNK